MKIYIARHGETEWNTLGKTQGSQDTPLTNKGLKQAELLKCRLEGKGITRIYSSTLSRAYETAMAVGRGLGIVPYVIPALREVGFGCWEGLTRTEIEMNYPGQLGLWHKDHDFYPESGESINMVLTRVRGFIDALKRDIASGQGNMAIISHSLTNRILLLELTGIPLDYLWSFRQDNSGINIVEFNGSKFSIACLNDTCHLDGIG